MSNLDWPELRLEQWDSTRETLNRWMQIIGKLRLSKSPWMNHSWNATLYVHERGLTTSLIHDKPTPFSAEFDFVHHVLRIVKVDGVATELPLKAQSVSDFYRAVLVVLRELGISARIHGSPNELMDALPFAEDSIHRDYNPEFAHRFWRALVQSDRVFKEFRARYIGKASPVHFFWGSFDLAVTRFSGRRAPEHPGGMPHLPDLVTREAYSHEVSSCGFWPGNTQFPLPIFYSYAYPQPTGFETAQVIEGAYYDPKLREFVLPYDAFLAGGAREELLMEFLESTYVAAASLGRWDRPSLEESPYLGRLQVLQAQKRAA